MPGGSLFPYSCIPVDTTGRTFADLFATAELGLGVGASITGDAIWRLKWLVPQDFSVSGVLTLNVQGMSGATGAVRINPKWAQGGNTASVLPTLTAEGTINYSYSATGTYSKSTTVLDAQVPSAGLILTMDLTFETSGWTVSSVSVWTTYLTWT